MPNRVPIVQTPPQWRRVLRPVLMIAALAVVFGWLLPRFIDYDEVWQAVTRLDGWEVCVLLGLALARVPTEALMYRAFLPGLGLWRGSQAFLSSNFASQLLPPPSASLVQYRYFRAEGYGSDRSRLAAAGSFLFPMVGRFLLPPAALVVLLVSGDVHGTILIAAAFALMITLALAFVTWLFLRTERSAHRVGTRVERPLARVLRVVKRDPVEDTAQRAAELRRQTLTILSEGWRLGSAGVAANLAITYLILLACLRFVGVSSGQLSTPDAFAAFAIAFWAGAVFPITGSGLGVVDTVLMVTLVEFSASDDDTLVAAALLWRVFYSFVILPIGAVTMSRMRTSAPQ